MRHTRRLPGLLPWLLLAGLPSQATADVATPIEILGTAVAPATTQRLSLSFGESFDGGPLTTPVLVAHGAIRGPVLCLTAAIHGDELNGVEVVRRLLREIEPVRLAGTVIGVPVVNMIGFTRGARETPDRRDLNRYFPGRAGGDFASRIAYQLFSQVIEPHCQYLIDFHTGSFQRANLPQLRADLANPAVRRFAMNFGDTPILRKRGSSRMLRRVASERGIPSVSLEFGEATTVQSAFVEAALASLKVALTRLGLLADGHAPDHARPQVYEKPFWIRAERGGIFLTRRQLGDEIVEGEIIGVIANPLAEEETPIRAPRAGRVLGLASEQFVLPGYGVYHVGRPAAAPTSAHDAER